MSVILGKTFLIIKKGILIFNNILQIVALQTTVPVT